MNPLLVHLIVVHVPVVGLLFAATTAVAAAAWNDRRLLLLALVFTAACVVAGVIAYASGPPAYDQLRLTLDGEAIAVADDHAVFGKVSFAVLMILGVGVTRTAILWAGGTPPPRWTAWALAAALTLSAILLSWTAHLGGGVHHPEARTELRFAETG